ncbi:MAG: hypothetical protein ACTSVZ_02355 [Promethearchaeota archaeon]
MAVIAGHLPIVQYLVDITHDGYHRRHSYLLEAIKAGQTSIVEYFMSPINEPYGRCSSITIQEGFLKAIELNLPGIVNILITAGADINGKNGCKIDQNPVYIAASFDHMALLNLFLAQGAKIPVIPLSRLARLSENMLVTLLEVGYRPEKITKNQRLLTRLRKWANYRLISHSDDAFAQEILRLDNEDFQIYL